MFGYLVAALANAKETAQNETVVGIMDALKRIIPYVKGDPQLTAMFKDALPTIYATLKEFGDDIRYMQVFNCLFVCLFVD